MKLSISALTDVGRVRSHNEDAFLAFDLANKELQIAPGDKVDLDVADRGVLLGVSDGMGGAQAGEIASALVVKTLDETLRGAEQDPDDAVLAEAITRANQVVRDAASEPGKEGMGATLTAVLFRGTTAYIASVGDSRAYVYRNGRLRQMTRDQSYVQVLIDAGLMGPEEAAESHFSSIILQNMGQKKDVQVAMGRLALRRDDRLFICSDGVTGHIKDDRLAELLAGDEPIDELTRKIIQEANDGGGTDNITAVIADVSGDDVRRVKGPESVTQTFEVLSEFEGPPMGADKKKRKKKSNQERPANTAPSGEDWDDMLSSKEGDAVAPEEQADAAAAPTSEDGAGFPIMPIAVFAVLVIAAAVIWSLTGSG